MIRTCTSCGQRNRVPSQRLTHVGRCGQCGNALPPLAEPIQVDAAQFREIVQSVDVPVLVDFWAGWCGPCRRAAPEVAKTAGDMAGRAVVLKVDVEAEPQLAQEYRVNGIPHFAVLRFGKAVFQQSGLVGHRDMTRWLVAAER